MDPSVLDQVRLNFNPQGLFIINAAIGLMMFGVALELKMDDFRRIFVAPKAPIIGLGSQFILLPAFTFLLTLILRPPPSIALGMILVAAALGANWQNFIDYVGLVFIGVLIHNALALNLGFWAGRLLRLSEPDVRAVAIEVGIQNSGLGLVLIFNFFGGLGGMAIITAWWGIWHIIAGLIAAFIFSRRRLPLDARQTA